ncbi:MAG: hypothetical protein JSV43_03915 [Methanobacteriota archaeon]|nr:MAG: hypothetical protein JSV43_03915 [Euryarchaeota archaeon]
MRLVTSEVEPLVEDIQSALSKMKVKELRAFAKHHDIDLRGKKTKKDIVKKIASHDDVESLLMMEIAKEPTEPITPEDELILDDEAFPDVEDVQVFGEPEPAFNEEDIREVLTNFKVSELKKMAKKYEIDISGCRKKSDYLDILSKKENIQLLLEEVGFRAKEKDLERIKGELIDVGVEIEETMEEIEALPSMKDEAADKMLIEARTIDVDFDDIEDMLDYARMRYEEENFDKSVELSEEAILKARSKYEDLMRLALAYHIMSNEKLIEGLSGSGRDFSKAVAILLQSKEAYKSGHLDEDLRLMEDLSTTIKDLYSEDAKKIRDTLYIMEGFVAEIANLGADLTVARDLLQRAREANRRHDSYEAARLMKRAKAVATKSKQLRIEEIRQMIPKTQNLIEEAQHLGADVGDAEKMLMQAQIALDNEDYILCAELAGRAKARAGEVQHYQIQKAMDIREKQTDDAKLRVERMANVLTEADMYGLDIAKARRLLYVARETIKEQDFYRMTKYVTSAQDAVDELMPRIKIERRRRGIEMPKAGLCGNCSSRDLDFSEDGYGQCMNCGKAFTWVVPPERSVWQKLRSFFWE